MPDSDLLPEIIIDDSAEGYVETDDEAEEEEPPEKSRPPASEIFHSHSQKKEKPEEEPVLEVELSLLTACARLQSISIVFVDMILKDEILPTIQPTR